MLSFFTTFCLKLIVLLVIAFGIHILALYLYELPLFENMIVPSYVINLILAIVIFGFIYKLRDKLSNQVGFMFLAGSLVKFAVFFIVFYPIFKADDNISRLEFASFFIPYILCLVIETFSLVKWLNKT